jgi:predicted Zn-dependent protease
MIVAAVLVCLASPAQAQLGRLRKGLEDAQKKLGDLRITEQEEQELGAALSAQIRARYGVVQDQALHKYVALVGSVLAQESSRPKLPWTFVVLDTDAVNAFAAPGGFVHITRGALGVIRNEAQLAGVLGHEITHIANRHTINAIRKSKGIQMAADESLSGNKELLDRVVNQAYEMVVEKGFDRDDELDSDKVGIKLANTVGYAPNGLGDFLTALIERNRSATARRGLFASHPETKDRIARLDRQIAADRLTASATVEARYRSHITFTAKPQSDIATVDPGVRGLAEGDAKAEEKKAEEKPAEKPAEKKRGFGLGFLAKPAGAEKQNAQVTASAGTRGVGDPDRDATGGGNPAIVRVAITAAELAAFRKGITG